MNENYRMLAAKKVIEENWLNTKVVEWTTKALRILWHAASYDWLTDTIHTWVPTNHQIIDTFIWAHEWYHAVVRHKLWIFNHIKIWLRASWAIVPVITFSSFQWSNFLDNYINTNGELDFLRKTLREDFTNHELFRIAVSFYLLNIAITLIEEWYVSYKATQHFDLWKDWETLNIYNLGAYAKSYSIGVVILFTINLLLNNF